MTSQDDTSTLQIPNDVPASRVFAIPELLEAILILLPPEDILTVQRVAKAWKQTIDASRRLPQALFIEPMAPETSWIAQLREDDDQPEPNAFKVGRYTVTQLPTTQTHEVYSATPQITTKVQLNTLLHHRGHWKHMTLDDRIERGEGLRLGRTKKKIFGYGRQMFLTQPPCKEVLIWIDWGQPRRVYSEEGVRFGQVLEVTEGEGVGTVAYLPHIFMLAKGVIALTEAEEEMVERELERGRQRIAGERRVDLGLVVEASPDVSLVPQPIQVVSEWNWVSGTVRRWIGW